MREPHWISCHFSSDESYLLKSLVFLARATQYSVEMYGIDYYCCYYYWSRLSSAMVTAPRLLEFKMHLDNTP